MLAESAKNLVPKFFDETGTTYDGVVSYGTLGKDKYWKRKILEQISDGDSFPGSRMWHWHPYQGNRRKISYCER